jgi:hypothetical protein
LPKVLHRSAGVGQEWGVLNLDSSNGQGIHWVCWYRDGENKYYFDSYGLDPPKELVKYLRPPIHCNTDQVQLCNTVVCCHLCHYVLKRFSIGDSFEEILINLI